LGYVYSGREGREIGELEYEGGRILISITKEMEESSFSSGTPTGFLFQADSLDVNGAVDVLNKGVVYMHRSSSESSRFAMANAAVALLVFGSRTQFN
jgi:hypothetical protein